MKAIIQVADSGPLESLVVMLRSAGFDCYLPSHALKQELRSLGCDTVLDIENLVRGWGYDQPMPLPEVKVSDMARSDVCYFDIKAHRNGPLVWKRWPNLRERTVWYRINGGKPEHVINDRGDHGDEVNPPCPILTPNLWYKGCEQCQSTGTDIQTNHDPKFPNAGRQCTRCRGEKQDPRFYACWPPFYRFEEYAVERKVKYTHPLCLIHNLQGWGYGALVENIRKLGVLCHGVSSPDGLIQHQEVKALLSRSLAMVHLKSSDAPGYALYEALASGCPIICSRRLIWRNRMQDLFIPGKTCLVFDRETHDGLTQDDVDSCTKEIKGHLSALSDPGYNQEIGNAGRAKLQELMWSEKREANVSSLKEFLGRVIK